MTTISFRDRRGKLAPRARHRVFAPARTPSGSCVRLWQSRKADRESRIVTKDIPLGITPK